MSQSSDMGRFPSWTVTSTPGEDGETKAFRLGVALQALKSAYQRDAPGWGCWMDRLCLRAASSVCGLQGRSASETELRDAIHLSGAGDPGPSGRIYRFMRQVYRDRSNVDEGVIIRELERTGVVIDARINEIAEIGPGSPPLPHRPLLSRLETLFVRSRRLRPDTVLLTLALADLALAREIRGPMIPLTAPSVSTIWKREQALLDELPARICTTAARAFDAMAASRSAASLLLEKAGAIRTRNRDRALDIIQANDVATASDLEGAMTDRSARRMLERLEAIGVVKEYSGRKTFRYYGL